MTIQRIIWSIAVILYSCMALLANDAKTIRAGYQDEATQKLMKNLVGLSEKRLTMFGVANGTSISYLDLQKIDHLDQSDCKAITGSNPAFIESDFMWYEENPRFMKADLEAMKIAFHRGGVLAYCWHIRGPKSKQFYSKNKQGKMNEDQYLVKEIVKGGLREENPSLDWYLGKIDSLVIPVFQELGFPIIFRPFHEMNGAWFWWGTDNCTPEEYGELFRISVDYIRSKGVRNVLYAWTPDTWFKTGYYPGDEYVDIVGLDIYEPGIFPGKSRKRMIKELEKMTDFAVSRGQVGAITETGCRKVNNKFTYPEKYPDFWTAYVLDIIRATEKTQRTVWVMSWYNADWRRDRTGQFYVPYPGMEKDHERGQEAIDDFIRLFQHPAMLFENNLPSMYD